MPFWKKDCFREPQRAAMHIYAPDEDGDWQEWTGTLSVGDIEIGAVELKNYGSDDRVFVSATHLLYVHHTDDQTFVTATGSSAVAMVVNPQVDADLQQVAIHLDAVGASGTLTIVNDNGAGAAYDTTLLSIDMTAVQNYLWIPARPFRLKATDKLNITWANAGGKTYGIEVVWSKH